jgi:hypothetical protein
MFTVLRTNERRPGLKHRGAFKTWRGSRSFGSKIQKETIMNTLRRFVTMIRNRPNSIGIVFGALALSVALLFPIEGRAQTAFSGDPVSFINFYTAGALDNGGSSVEGSQLKTSVWRGNASSSTQRWQIFLDKNGPTAIGRIASMNSFKVADVASHCALPFLPVIQTNEIWTDALLPACNSRQLTFAFRFQRWEFTRLGNTSHFFVKNSATGMCLADLGNPESGIVGGPVVQQTCDFGPRQLWAVFDFNMGSWQ